MAGSKKKAPPRSKPQTIVAELVEDPPEQQIAVREDASLHRLIRQPHSLLHDFLATLGTGSVASYRGDLGDFTSWALCGDTDRKVVQRPTDEEVAATLRHLLEGGVGLANEATLGFRTHLLKRGLAPNTVNRKLAALRSIVKMARLAGAVNWEIEIPGVETELVRETEGCGAEGYKALVETAEGLVEEAQDELRGAKTKIEKKLASRSLTVALRDHALLRLYHDAGLRRSEPLDIMWPDEVEYGRKPRIRFRGKKRRTRAWHAINKRCVKAIKDWVAFRGDEPGPLFISTHPSHYGKPLHMRTINKRIKKLAELAEVKVTPHGLRHTAATTLLDKGGGVRAVAEFLRHKGLGIVQAYDDRRKELPREMGDLLDD